MSARSEANAPVLRLVRRPSGRAARPDAVALSARPGAPDDGLIELDALRGLAGVAMVLNHAGFSLLDKGATTHGFTGALVFFGSFAPVLFFFATGMGMGLSAQPSGALARAWPKVALLVAADQFLFWSRGEPGGLDFFGFIALSMLLLAALASLPSAVRWACAALLGVITLRFGIGALLGDRISAPGVLAFLTGARPQDHVSFPVGPWLAYPLAGFVAARAFVAGSRRGSRWSVLRRGRAATLTMTLTLAVGTASAAWLWLHGASFFRWGSMGVGFFALSVAVLSACGLLVQGLCRWAPSLGRALALRGVAAFLLVPLHYAIVKTLALSGVAILTSTGYVLLTTMVIVACFAVARAMAATLQSVGPPRGVAAGLTFGLMSAAAIAAIVLHSQWPALGFGAAMLGQLAAAAALGWRAHAVYAPTRQQLQ